MVGNTLPAINDITASELMSVVEDIAQFCPVIQASSMQYIAVCHHTRPVD